MDSHRDAKQVIQYIIPKQSTKKLDINVSIASPCNDQKPNGTHYVDCVKIITSPWPVMNELAPSNKGNKMVCTSDGALSISSKTTQYPFRIACKGRQFETITT